MFQPIVEKSPKQLSRIPVRHLQQRGQSVPITRIGGRSTSETTPAASSSMVSSASTTASDLAARASMLESPNGNVRIEDSQLNAAGRDHFSITYNYNMPPSYLPAGNEKPSVENHCEPQRKAGSELGTRAVSDEDAQIIENLAKQEAMMKELAGGNINGAIWSSRTPEQCAIYVRNLLLKGHGWPIYIPGPSKRLPMAYRKEGMHIGDVGVINLRGSFEFLFNICHPADHPINVQGVPKNFKQLQIDPTDIQEHSEFNGESYISSSSITNSSGLKFESSASEGAILAMPIGAISEDVMNEAIFKKYVRIHAEDWYRYINNIRGRDAKNGDLRLVTGYHKTSSWCIATFANSTANEKPFHLEFNHVSETNAGKVYKWKHSGTAEVRTGPGPQEIQDLRRGDPDHEGRNYQNQALFARTISATLRENIWNEIAAEFDKVDVDDDSVDDTPPESSNQGFTGSTRTNSTTYSTSTSANAPGQRTTLAMTNDMSMSPFNQLTDSLQEPTMPYHPSDAINEMLLKLNPSARVAITSDNDWISVLQKDDYIFPSIEQLCVRIKASLIIRQDKDVVSLEKPESPTTSPCIENVSEERSLTIEPSTSGVGGSMDVMSTGREGVTTSESATVSTPEISNLSQASDLRNLPRPCRSSFDSKSGNKPEEMSKNFFVRPLAPKVLHKRSCVDFEVVTRASNLSVVARKALESIPVDASVILPTLNKCVELDMVGQSPLNHLWIAIYSRPGRVALVLSCTDGYMGAYPIFIVNTNATDDIDLTPFVQSSTLALQRHVPAERVYSVFGPNRIARLFSKMWTQLTGVQAEPQPYYDATISCLRRHEAPPSFSLVDSSMFEVGLAGQADIVPIAKLCHAFASDSSQPPFVLTEEAALIEAKKLVSSRQVWTHKLNGRVTSIAAFTRNTRQVATITKVYTDADFRGFGCAERLVKRLCKSLLHDKGREAVVCFAPCEGRITRVYRRVGFQGLDDIVDGSSDDNRNRWLEVGFDRGKVTLGHW